MECTIYCSVKHYPKSNPWNNNKKNAIHGVSFEVLFQFKDIGKGIDACLVQIENGQTKQCDEQPTEVGIVLHLCYALYLWRMNLIFKVDGYHF